MSRHRPAPAACLCLHIEGNISTLSQSSQQGDYPRGGNFPILTIFSHDLAKKVKMRHIRSQNHHDVLNAGKDGRYVQLHQEGLECTNLHQFGMF